MLLAPKDVHVRILETCDYVTSLGKTDFAGVTKLRILWGEDYPGLSRWTQCERKCSSKGTRGQECQNMDGCRDEEAAVCMTQPLKEGSPALSDNMDGPQGYGAVK